MLNSIIISHIHENHFAFYLYAIMLKVERWNWDNINSSNYFQLPWCQASSVIYLRKDGQEMRMFSCGSCPIALFRKVTWNLAEGSVSCCLSTVAEIEVSAYSVLLKSMLIKCSNEKSNQAFTLSDATHLEVPSSHSCCHLLFFCKNI